MCEFLYHALDVPGWDELVRMGVRFHSPTDHIGFGVQVNDDRVFRQLGLALVMVDRRHAPVTDPSGVCAGIVITRTVDHLFHVEATQQDVLVFVNQTHVVGDLETLKPFFDAGQHVQHALLFLIGEMVGVGNRKVIVQMVVDAPLEAPGVNAVDECRHSRVFATDDDDAHFIDSLIR